MPPSFQWKTSTMTWESHHPREWRRRHTGTKHDMTMIHGMKQWEIAIGINGIRNNEYTWPVALDVATSATTSTASRRSIAGKTPTTRRSRNLPVCIINLKTAMMERIMSLNLRLRLKSRLCRLHEIRGMKQRELAATSYSNRWNEKHWM